MKYLHGKNNWNNNDLWVYDSPWKLKITKYKILISLAKGEKLICAALCGTLLE